MTDISERIIAVEVPKEVPISDIEVIGNELFYKYGNIKRDCVRQLPDYKKYKFLCLASEANDNPHKFTFIEMCEIAALSSSKEYALIEVQ